MPFPLVSSLPFYKTTSDPVELLFTAEPLAHKQSRLQGRCALKPNINLGDYTFKAVIDWIELKFELASATQRQHAEYPLNSSGRSMPK